MPSSTVTSLIALAVVGVCIYGIVASWMSYNKAKKSVEAQKEQKVLPVILEDSVSAMNNKRKVAIGVTIFLLVCIIGVLLYARSLIRKNYLNSYQP